ncbi:hypothetical protein ACMGDM_19045 [Sphingomonas sp. DT-51]|uniref:hypothetical protein n=1 Tax=Sphingomonas sp. DT-51 TaxID=3396165 RepID=UPI003F1C49AB
MSFHLLVGTRALLSGDGTRIPAAERESFLDAVALLDRAARHEEGVAQKVADARSEGWQAGHAAGIAAIEESISAALCEISAAAAAHARTRRDEIASAALAAVTAMIGALDPADAAMRAALTAAAQLPDDDRLTVACSPEVATLLSAALAQRDDTTVEERPDYPVTRVELLTGGGRVVAGLDVQLAQLADRWDVER